MLQAALSLADWCLCNCEFLRNRRILELGSGTGLTGLCVSLHCKPSSYWFSDCHPAVLSMLQSNILLNVMGQNNHVLGDSHEDNSVVAHTCSGDENVSLTYDGHGRSELCDRSQILLWKMCNNAEIGVLNLPWEIIPTSDFVTWLSPEVILAAGLFTRDCGLKVHSAVKLMLTLYVHVSTTGTVCANSKFYVAVELIM